MSTSSSDSEILVVDLPLDSPPIKTEDCALNLSMKKEEPEPTTSAAPRTLSPGTAHGDAFAPTWTSPTGSHTSQRIAALIDQDLLQFVREYKYIIIFN